MINFDEIFIKSEADYEAIKKILPQNLIDDLVIDTIRKYIGLRCDTVVVEYPYYDRDYLSTYYNHYSMKFKKYEKKCCRLHFEKGNDYYGFVTLRPTIEGTKIGKTYLSPKLLIDKTAYLMLSNHIAHVYGSEMIIEAFPWKQQQTDISRCAHTAVWTIIRYFSSRHRGYTDATIGDLVDHVKNDRGRKTPSQGLTPIQVSDLFKVYGYSPLVIENNIFNRNEAYSKFVEEIFSYIESGLPMVGFITPLGHAVALIGHGRVNYDLLDDDVFVASNLDKDANVLSHTKLIESAYVMDDNAFPYREVPCLLPDSNSDVRYGMSQFRYAVIPLYEKMQLTYSEVYDRMVQWLKLKAMNWEERNVCRIYLTSSNSLKRLAAKSDTMSEDLKELILRLSFPKFVWCIDLAGIENYKNHMTSGRIIIDATSATHDSEPWILRHDMAKIEYKDYDESADYKYTIKTNIKPYKIYENNLKELN